jgi:uncharacterized protein YsxB (DUF464 family)
MITATITPRALVIEGHAGYAPRGYDIVCEAVSILSETLAACYPPERVTEITPGRAELDITDLTHDEETLLNAYLTGMRMLADTYPAHVRIKNGRKTDANTPDTSRPEGREK